MAQIVQRLDIIKCYPLISVNKTNLTIQWIAIYLADSIVHPLNNWGMVE